MVLNPFKFWEDQRKASFPGAALVPAKRPCIAFPVFLLLVCSITLQCIV